MVRFIVAASLLAVACTKVHAQASLNIVGSDIGTKATPLPGYIPTIL